MDSIDPTLALLQARAAENNAPAADPTLSLLQARAAEPDSAPQAAPNPNDWSQGMQPGQGLVDNAIADAKLQAHRLGLGARFVAEGAATIPTLAADATTGLMNGGVLGYNKITGSHVPYIPLPSSYQSDSLSNLGFAAPANKDERLTGDIVRPLVGVGSSIQAGSELASKAATPTMKKIGEFLASSPTAQAQAAAGGGLASGEARENGASPGWQAAYGLLGGIATPSAISAGIGVKDALQPLTNNGRNQMVANILGKYADDPQQAITNMQNAPIHVPGSLPTSGTASGDYGLINMEKTLQQSTPFAQRISDQNSARTALIDGVAGTDTDLQKLKDARQAATEPLYQQAKLEQVKPQAVQPVLDAIDAKIAELGPQSDAGKVLLGMKSDIKAGLPATTAKPSGLLDASGNPIMNTTTTPKPLTQMVQTYRETRDALAKDAMQPGAYAATVKSQIAPINHMLGQALEKSSPVFGQAQATHAALSKPIDQMTNMQTLRDRMTGTGQDVNGNYFFGTAPTTKIVKAGEMKTDYKGVVPLKEAVSPQQLDAVNAVQKDLARSNLVNQPTVRPPGSNTFNNTASDTMLNNNVAAALASRVPFGLGTMLYKNVNPLLKEKLAEAMLNPTNAEGTGAAQLLAKAKPLAPAPNVQSIINNLMRTGTIGAGAGYSTAVQ